MQTKYIGNIITGYSKDKFPSFFNITKKYEERLPNIPTIIVGLEEARANIDGFLIIKKRYNDVWWTYRKTERKYEFDKDIEEFYSYCFKKFLSDVRYFYLNLPKYRYTDVKRIYNWIKEKELKLCFLTRDSNFIFIYDVEKNTVFGLSLTLCEYIGVERKKVVNLIKTNRYNKFVYDTGFITSDVRGIVGNNTHYILPLASVLSGS